MRLEGRSDVGAERKRLEGSHLLPPTQRSAWLAPLFIQVLLQCHLFIQTFSASPPPSTSKISTHSPSLYPYLAIFSSQHLLLPGITFD